MARFFENKERLVANSEETVKRSKVKKRSFMKSDTEGIIGGNQFGITISDCGKVR